MKEIVHFYAIGFKNKVNLSLHTHTHTYIQCTHTHTHSNKKRVIFFTIREIDYIIDPNSSSKVMSLNSSMPLPLQ
eukprot:m.91303 g.91303  ORF g.91303 m.91303 type:complete len:75 (+) comp12326_c0_seq7:1777-2001(+)